MSQTPCNLSVALRNKLLERRNQKLASWKTFIDSNNITRCAFSELPVEDCLIMDPQCCNCKKYKPCDFIIIDSQKIYYHELEKKLQ